MTCSPETNNRENSLKYMKNNRKCFLHVVNVIIAPVAWRSRPERPE